MEKTTALVVAWPLPQEHRGPDSPGFSLPRLAAPETDSNRRLSEILSQSFLGLCFGDPMAGWGFETGPT